MVPILSLRYVHVQGLAKVQAPGQEVFLKCWILFFGVLKAHGFRSAARNGSRAERLLTRVGFSLIAGSYPAYYGVPGVESRALLPEGRVPAGRAGGSEEGNHGL